MILCLVTTGAANAQRSTNRVDAKIDWSVFVENNPEKTCWIVSKPIKTLNTRGGQVVSARRSDILLWVHYRPSDSVMGVVSFTGGYPFDPNRVIKLKVRNKAFELYADGEYAWPASTKEDPVIRDALKRGATAVVTAYSRRGTKTQDTFSLKGFTAALSEAEKRCR